MKTWVAVFAIACAVAFSVQSAEPAATNAVRIVELQGTVDVFPAGEKTWSTATNNQPLSAHDRIRTAANSRVALRWSDQSVVPFGASTELEVLPPDAADTQSGLHLIRGVVSFFHRDQPGRIHIITRGAVAGVEGTEFVLAVNDADRTTLSVVDGKVRIGNDQGTLQLTNGQQAVVDLGRPPERTAGFIANNLLQWCFYYPAVLDPDELQLTVDEQNSLSNSLAAYRSGDLQLALKQYPAGNSGSDAEKLYHAAVLLSVGDVAQTEIILDSLANQSGRNQQLADSLRQLVAAVKLQSSVLTGEPRLTSERLADSYFQQSRAVRDISLRKALADAKQAAAKSPKFGFAWERVAELEFSFGRTKDALTALDKSLALAPRNAQALALKGFILNAENDPHAALASFNAAIAADSALGNAWLGRGIVSIRLRNTEAGREDLLVAAALEPQRSELRSYLGKAYVATGDDAHATKELNIAKRLDPNDPTPWLYSALQKQQNSQINDAIRDLEKSQALNDNRSVYRSSLLLDQDQAVRAADLAGIYQDAGMSDWATIEAGKAVSYDYANYSAHLFLANSYQQLRDPNWSNLRYETPAVTEYNIAQLLAPASAGVLSSVTSQQPYTKLFDQNRVGVVSDTTYLSRGSWFQDGAQYGTYDNFSYSLDANYISENGQRTDNDNEHRYLSLTIKNQFTPQDTAFASVDQSKINSGDLNEYYDRSMANTTVRVNESQQRPNFYLGYHHEWSPGAHTLFYGAYLTGNENINAGNSGQIFTTWNFAPDLSIDPNAGIHAAAYFYTPENLTVSPEIYSTELQQIWEHPDHTTVVGARYQWGDIHYQNWQGNSPDLLALLYFPDSPGTIIDQNFTTDFHRLSFYGYHNWQIADSLLLVGGLDYDELHLPADVATTPFSPQERTVTQFSPKAGFIWTPARNTTVRAAYTRSLSGAVNDQSIRIEPTQVAGFNQAFRSIAPESSVAGNTSGADFQTGDVALEQKFDTGTYLSLSGEILYSKDNPLAGSYNFYGAQVFTNDFPIYPDGINESVTYHEESLLFTADQLLGKQWAAGARYRLSQAKLDLSYVDVPAQLPDPNPNFQPRQNLKSVLNLVNLHLNWNHPCGLFSIFEANWFHQSNSGFNPAEPGDDFWMLNAYAGWRFWHRRAELTVGLLNITDQDYKLEPLNLYNEMPYGRTFMTRLRINF